MFFGLIQKEGGPCGVLACVQAYFLKHLILLGGGGSRVGVKRSEEDEKRRKNCLIASLSEIL